MRKNAVVIFLAMFLTSCTIENTSIEVTDVSAFTEDNKTQDIFSSFDYSEIETPTQITDTLITSEITVIVENSEKIIPFKYKNDISENNYSTYAEMDDEIKVLLKQAENLYYDFFLCIDKTTFNWEKTVTITVINENSDGNVNSYDDDYSLTGISYDSFKKSLLQVFTDDFVENDLLKRTLYRDYNGELCYYPYYGYVRNDCFDSISFSVSSQTERKITITGTAYYSDPDDSSVQWEYTYDYDIVLAENGWRVDSFENWD